MCAMQTVGLCCAASVAAAAFRGRPVNCSGIRASNKKAKNWSFESFCVSHSLSYIYNIKQQQLEVYQGKRREAPFVEFVQSARSRASRGYEKLLCAPLREVFSCSSVSELITTTLNFMLRRITCYWCIKVN